MFAGIVMLPLLIIYMRPGRLYKHNDFFTVNEQIYGKGFGKCINGFYVLIGLFMCARSEERRVGKEC